MAVSAAEVKALRERTGAPIVDVKNALEEAEGDEPKAIEILRKKGEASAAKRSGRGTAEGVVAAYTHMSGTGERKQQRIGVLVEVQCETDFVALNDDFKEFARDVAIHIAAMNPQHVSLEDIPEEDVANERRILEEKAKADGKPDDIVAKIVDGQIKKWASEIVLLDQQHFNEEQVRGQDDRGPARRGCRQDRRERPHRPLRALRGGTGVGPALAEAGFNRILLKLSGEALMGDLDYGTDPEQIERIANQVREVRVQEVEVAIVVGAGNIYRGLEGAAKGMDRATADYMGMLATVLNALTLQDALEKVGVDTRVFSAMAVTEVAEPYIRRRAIRHLEKGRAVIFAAGTGNPFFTTDTAAALRALEIHAEAILMAKNGVEGVYSADPSVDPTAEFLPEISHRQAIERGLRVMDSTALSLCMDNDLPIYVFNMADERNIDRIVSGERVGTLVSSKPATEPAPGVRS